MSHRTGFRIFAAKTRQAMPANRSRRQPRVAVDTDPPDGVDKSTSRCSWCDTHGGSAELRGRRRADHANDFERPITSSCCRSFPAVEDQGYPVLSRLPPDHLIFMTAPCCTIRSPAVVGQHPARFSGMGLVAGIFTRAEDAIPPATRVRWRRCLHLRGPITIWQLQTQGDARPAPATSPPWHRATLAAPPYCSSFAFTKTSRKISPLRSRDHTRPTECTRWIVTT